MLKQLLNENNGLLLILRLTSKVYDFLLVFYSELEPSSAISRESQTLTRPVNQNCSRRRTSWQSNLTQCRIAAAHARIIQSYSPVGGKVYRHRFNWTPRVSPRTASQSAHPSLQDSRHILYTIAMRCPPKLSL